MPAAIAAAIVKFVGAKALLAKVITAVIKVAVIAAATSLVQAIFLGGRPKPSDGQIAVRGSVESRRRHYGIIHTSGVESFKESANGTLGMVVTLGTGEETEILQHRLNDQVVTLNGSGVVTQASYRGAVRVLTRMGTDDQTAISELTAIFPQWTPDHRQRNCAHAAVICAPVKQEHFSEVYNGREPAYSSVRKGVKVYDPRKDSTFPGGSGSHRLNDKSTWEWSDTGALVIADYVAHADGYGLGYDNINWANIAAEATICDETLTTISAETIRRWRLWGTYKLSVDERRTVLGDMLRAVDGFCWQGPDFRFNLMVGRYEEPDVTITDDHILGGGATLGPQAQQRVSAMKVLYTEAAIGYREQESALVLVPDAEEDPNTDPQAVELFWAPHHNQAARVGKLIATSLGDRWHLNLTTNLFGLNLFGKRFCRVRSAELDIDAAFKIEDGVKLTIGRDRITVSFALVEMRPEDWDFDAATEEGTPPLAPGVTTPTIVVPVPTGLALNAVQIVLAEGNGVAIEATWDAGRADLAHEVRYRPSAGGTWVLMAVDNDAGTARSGAVDSGTEYEVQIRALTIGYRASAWSASVTITPTASATLDAPTALSAIGGTGEADVSFAMPTSTSLSFARLYRTATSSFTSPAQVGSDITAAAGALVSITDSGLAAGTYFYWARAFNGSGGSSALTGPVSATVT